MAKNNLPPALQGIDYSQWQSWKPVTIQGLTYYEIPGRQGFIYNPYGGGSQGEIARDPRAIEELVKQEEKANTPSQAGQIGGAVASLGGLYAGSKLIPNLIGGSKVAGATATAIPTATTATTATGATTGATGLTGALGAGQTATVGTGATTGTAGATGASSGLGLMGIAPYAGALAGTYLVGKGAKDLLQREKGDLLSRGSLGIATGGLSEVARAVMGGKGKEQIARDSSRKDLQGALGIGNDWQLKFSDGGSFDIGKDGGAKLQNLGKNIDGRTDRNYYDVDFSNDVAKNSVAKIQGLLGNRYEAGSKLGSDTVGMLVNAVTAGTNDQSIVDKRIAELQNKLGGGSSNGVMGMTMPTQPQVNRSRTRSAGIDKNGRRISY